MSQGLTVVCEWAEKSGGDSTALKALIGTRVGRNKLQDGFTNTQPALKISGSAEDGHLTAGVKADRYLFTCYGGVNAGGVATQEGAEAVEEALYTAFQNKAGDTASGGMVLAEKETSTVTEDPDTGYPIVLATYLIRTA